MRTGSTTSRTRLAAGSAVVAFALLSGTAHGSASPPARSLADADVELVADVPGGWVGFDVAVLGDLDADGYDDYVIGGMSDDTNGETAGVVYLVYGPVSGQVRLRDVAAVFHGLEAGDFVGERVGAAGDIDGDGYDDLLIGAPGASVDQADAIRPGLAYLFHGGPERLSGEVSLTDADAVFHGLHPMDFAGFGLPKGAVGDLDGDDIDDLVMGSAGLGTLGGGVYVFYGRTERFTGDVPLAEADVLYTGAGTEYAGWEIAGNLDLDGDGHADLAVTAPDIIASGFGAGVRPGSVYVLYGGPRRTGVLPLALADAHLVGESAADTTGWGVAAADLDGDGFDDLAIGAPRASDGQDRTGAVYILYGSSDRLAGQVDLGTADAKLVGEDANSWTGAAVAAGADLEGNGSPDLAVGAPGRVWNPGTEQGAVYVVPGGSRLSGTLALTTEASVIWFGADPRDSAGSAVDMGHVGLDGRPFLVVGAHGATTGAAPLSGGAYVIYAPPGDAAAGG